MQDIDDFDPLDDILLSDDDLPQSKIMTGDTSFLQQNKETESDNTLRKNKKKKMLAELFGTEEEETKKEEKSNLTFSAQNKSDWLDLKTEEVKLSLTNTDYYDNRNFLSDKSLDGSIENKMRDKEKTVYISSNFDIDQRKSEGNSLLDVRKTKQRYKSLDEFDSMEDITKPSEVMSTDFTNQNKDEESGRNSNLNRRNTDEINQKSLYTPSIGQNRRFGISKSQHMHSDEKNPFSLILPENSQSFTSDFTKDNLPSWLEPKTEIKTTVSVLATDNNLRSQHNMLVTENTSLLKSEDEMKISNKIKPVDNVHHEINKVKENHQTNIVSTVLELVRKQEELKQLARNQVESLTQHEQEIQNSAFELIQQQRDSIKALLQIVSFDDMLQKCNNKTTATNQNEIINAKENLENIFQLQTKLTQQELEKAELEMKLKHVERKHMIDLTMLEDVYKCKLQVAEEKEIHFRKEIQLLEEEYNLKFSKRKENEEELIRTYNEKIKTLQEEHLNEMKHVIELHNLKYSLGPVLHEKNETKNVDHIINKEITLREIAVEDKEKQLLEFEERLSREKLLLDGKRESLEIRIEELDTKIAKEKLNLDQQRRALKLEQNIFEEKGMFWEHEKEREKGYLSNYKQELEVLKENLLREERKLMKEKFEITVEKARLEAIISSEGNTGGHTSNIIQSRAELHGTIEEVRRLKSKLESERNEIKNETMRLKEEKWKLRDIEQELKLQQRHFQKMIQEAEMKHEEGIRAMQKAQMIENQMSERMEEIGKRSVDLNQKEEQLTKEKIEISKERDLLNKKKYQLDLLLPQLSYEEQLPFNLLNKNIIDPRIMIMKLKAENDIDSILNQ